MENMDFTIEKDDLKCLYIACKLTLSFDAFVKECEQNYIEYHKRNLDNLEKYGQPKTYSQWVNGQTIALNCYKI